MSGFDLTNAREICNFLQSEANANDDNKEKVRRMTFVAATMLPAAIERIEELEAENKSLLVWADTYVAEIADLQERIEKLQVALIDERAQSNCYYRTNEPWDNDPEAKPNEKRKAREQLQNEGLL